MNLSNLSCWFSRQRGLQQRQLYDHFSYLRSLCYLLSISLFPSFCLTQAQGAEPHFKALAFYTGKNDQAHISFVREANRWFAGKAQEANFDYRSTTNWSDLNAETV